MGVCVFSVSGRGGDRAAAAVLENAILMMGLQFLALILFFRRTPLRINYQISLRVFLQRFPTYCIICLWFKIEILNCRRRHMRSTFAGEGEQCVFSQ